MPKASLISLSASWSWGFLRIQGNGLRKGCLGILITLQHCQRSPLHNRASQLTSHNLP